MQLIPRPRSVLRLVARGGTAAACAAALVLAAAVPARAGGQIVDLAVGGGRLWLVGDQGVQTLTSSGHTLTTLTLADAAYPLTVTLAGGAAWVGSVENGFVNGTLSRIDTRTRHIQVVWRSELSSVQYVAAGAGSVWALIGIRGGMEAARFNLDGHLRQVWKLPRDVGRMTADDSGCWISSNGTLLHIDPRGRLHQALQAPFGDLATGGGAVWLAEHTKVIRLDERTGQTRSIHTGPLRLGGFQHDLAATTDALYLLQHNYTKPTSRLVRIDLHTGSISRSAAITGITDAVAVTRNEVWVASSTSTIYRYDPRTLRRTLTVDQP